MSAKCKAAIQEAYRRYKARKSRKAAWATDPSHEELVRLRQDFLAHGGRIERLPPGRAQESVVPIEERRKRWSFTGEWV